MTRQYDSLLDWAVENLDKWDTNFTHLRIDQSWYYPFFTCGYWSILLDNTWTPTLNWTGNLKFLKIRKPPNLSPAVITKKEWLEAKELKRKQQDKNMTYAEKCGLKVGSVIVYVGDSRLSPHGRFKIGEKLTLTVEDDYIPKFTNGEFENSFDIRLRQWEHYGQEKKNMSRKFTKSNLRSGHRVTLRNSAVGIVFLDSAYSDRPVISFFGGAWSDLSQNYRDDLSSAIAPGSDVVKVEHVEVYNFLNPKAVGKILWQEETEAQRQHKSLMQKIEAHEELLKETQESLAELKKQAKKLENNCDICQ